MSVGAIAPILKLSRRRDGWRASPMTGRPEMARLGAKVLQARSVEFAKKYDVPVVVKSSFSEGGGTLVTRPEQDMEQVIVAGVTADKNQAKITLTHVPDRPGIAAKLFGRIAAAD